MIIGYSPSEAHKAFVPPLSQRAIKLALKRRELVSRRIGNQRVILASDLEKWVASHPLYNYTRVKHAPEE